MVAAAIRTIFAQPDAAHVRSQLDEVARMLDAQFPDVAAMLRDAAEDLLAFTAFPHRALAQDLVDQPARAAQRRDQAPHQRRGHLPQRRRRSSASSPPSSSRPTTNGPSPNAATSPKNPWPTSASPPPPSRRRPSPSPPDTLTDVVDDHNGADLHHPTGHDRDESIDGLTYLSVHKGACVTSLAPYMVSIPEPALDDLRTRLARTRWIDDLPGSQWRLGVSQPYLRELCDYWRTSFDWRAQEAQLNAFDQHLIEVDGQPIHVVHARSQRSDALPLLLIHGWPGSVFEYIKVFQPLADPTAFGGAARDSFHVVAPSIPGYGFSGPTTESGWGPTRIASAFATLMGTLGYERYGLAGGDWGAIISTELARLDGGRHVCAVHLTMPLGKPPPDGRRDRLSADELRGLDDWAAHQAAGTVVHVAVNSTRPHTLAFGLNDSPAGLAAWLVDKYRSYSDCDGDVETAFTHEELLTEISTYWLTGTIASASRLTTSAQWRRA